MPAFIDPQPGDMAVWNLLTWDYPTTVPAVRRDLRYVVEFIRDCGIGCCACCVIRENLTADAPVYYNVGDEINVGYGDTNLSAYNPDTFTMYDTIMQATGG